MQPPRPRRNRIVVGVPLYAPASPRWIARWEEFKLELSQYERNGGIVYVAMTHGDYAMNTLVRNLLLQGAEQDRPSEALSNLEPEMERLRADGDPEIRSIAEAITKELTIHKWDYALFCETDNTMPAGVVAKVAQLDPRRHKVIGFPYFGRTDENLMPIPGNWKEDGSWNRLTYDEIKPMFDKPGFYEVGSVGLGCTAVHRSIFEDWPEEEFGGWFRNGYGRGPEFVGYDVRFCEQVHKQGHKVWLCTELEAGHLGEFMSTSRHFFATHEHMQQRESEVKSKREQAKTEFLNREPAKGITIATKHPLAAESIDHRHPFGAVLDNSVSPEFNRRLFAARSTVRLLDLGCAGGGLVESIIQDGGFAVGIEGSDAAWRRGLGAWPRIPDKLFTADIGQPFVLCRGDRPLAFDVVTAWEVLEHIPDNHLDELMGNVLRHLDQDGWFIASISTVESWHEERQYHATIRPRDWWMELFAKHGLRIRPDLMPEFEGSWVRGPNTGLPHSFCVVISR